MSNLKMKYNKAHGFNKVKEIKVELFRATSVKFIKVILLHVFFF
jgi:hypothetical protein